MDALLSVADAQVDQEDYYLDLDAGADAGVEDFDFKLDGAYEDEARVEDNPELAAPKTNADFEISYEDEESVREAIENEPKHGDNTADEAEHDAGQDVDVEYNDEIGYEDEELNANNNITDSGVAGSGTASADLRLGMPASPEAELLDENEEFDGPNEANMSMFNAADPSVDPSADTTDGVSTHRSQHDQAHTSASGLGGHRETPAGLSAASPASDVPEITVHYNQGQYSLIGAPSDDPDSYFLSDVKHLDVPLSQLLASIRGVISDEVSEEDELVVRIDSLDLEFGEKSNQKFLGRNFHDILRCFSALFNTSPDDAQELEFDLIMRRDCEQRFLELLEEAGIAGDQPDLSQDGGEVEGEISALEEGSVDEYSEEFDDGEGLATAMGDGDVSEKPEESHELSKPQGASEAGDDTMGEALDLHPDLAQAEVAESTELEAGGESMFHEEFEEFQPESASMAGNMEREAPEILATSGDLDEAFMRGEIFYEQELTIDVTEQTAEQGVDEWSGEASGQAHTGADEASVPHDLGSASMLVPTLHALPSLTTIHEQSDVGGDTASSFGQGDTHATVPGPSVDDNAGAETTAGEAQEIKSRHTSRTSTVNGDEIGYEENNQAGVEPKHGLEQNLEPLGDEIDWDHDGEEDGEQEAAEPTPSGKRSRTNETEDLSDGTDNKRRRT
ncbi:hypothetical protein QBC34DRAFT_5404 [Podospora aff. communis PSN243]|uniref:Glutamic acid-rich protein n=1 Tax=Podospora aff. communis PSN243 TaxID=3040156 RepID=A0AAV9H5J4_9PEZI|nr:hypothetical protein QBC34DRAFT_5404 [Podospora aff. communis PSN243]